MRPKSVFNACFSILLACLVGCSDGTPNSKDSDASSERSQGTPYTIVTTTGIITDTARQIAGDRAKVIGLMNSGIDPHLFQPTRKDIQTLMSADVVFYNGLHLEGKMIDALDRVAKKTTTRAVTESLDKSSLFTPPEFEGNFDPHVWMDPIAWAQGAQEIHKTLVEFDPDGQVHYDENADDLASKIEALDAYAKSSLDSIPIEHRVLITAHDAFSYFGRRYNIEVVGIQGISTESEAGVRDIERIVDMLVTRKIKAVFVETTVSDRNIMALIAGAKNRGHDVIVGGSLFSDAMGKEGTYEGTYIGMIDHNVTLITRALGGEAPIKGLNGLLTQSEP